MLHIKHIVKYILNIALLSVINNNEPVANNKINNQKEPCKRIFSLQSEFQLHRQEIHWQEQQRPDSQKIP